MKNWYDDDDVEITPEKQEEWNYVLEAFQGKVGRRWSREPCPRCRDLEGKDDRKNSLNYNPETGGYNCFRCSMKGRLPLSFRERLTDEYDGLPVAPIEKKIEPVELATGFVPIFEGQALSISSYDWARSYLLHKRKLQLENCTEAFVGAVLGGRLHGRIVVPIPEYQNDLVLWDRPWRGWVARDVTGRSTLTYRYAKNMIREGLLYNSPVLFRHTEQVCFIVEGTLDALALWPDAVAVLGKPLASQMDLLLQARRPLVVVLDGDAWELGQSLAWTLRMCGKRAGNVRLPPKTDPDEVERGWLMDQAWRSLV